MSSTRQAHVLVVEDEAPDRRLFSRVLGQHDTRITGVSRAFEALSFLESRECLDDPLRLILLDWKLPGGGARVLETVRDTPELKLTPVVVLSRSKAHVDVEAAYEAGANAFVDKPSDLYEFERRLGLICEFWLSVAIDTTPMIEGSP